MGAFIARRLRSQWKLPTSSLPRATATPENIRRARNTESEPLRIQSHKTRKTIQNPNRLNPRTLPQKPARSMRTTRRFAPQRPDSVVWVISDGRKLLLKFKTTTLNPKPCFHLWHQPQVIHRGIVFLSSRGISPDGEVLGSRDSCSCLLPEFLLEAAISNRQQ